MKPVYSAFTKLFLLSVVCTLIVFLIIPSDFINISQTEYVFNIPKYFLFILILLPILILFLASRLLKVLMVVSSDVGYSVIAQNSSLEGVQKLFIGWISRFAGKPVTLEDIQKVGIKLYDLFVFAMLFIYLILNLILFTPVIGNFLKQNLLFLMISFICIILISVFGIMLIYAKVYFKKM